MGCSRDNCTLRFVQEMGVPFFYVVVEVIQEAFQWLPHLYDLDVVPVKMHSSLHCNILYCGIWWCLDTCMSVFSVVCSKAQESLFANQVNEWIYFIAKYKMENCFLCHLRKLGVRGGWFVMVRRVERVLYRSFHENWILCMCVVFSAWTCAVYVPLVINTAALPLARPCPVI